MICKSCSTPNQDHFKFCRECGQRLAAPALAGEAAIAASAPAPPPSLSAAPPPIDEVVQAARLLDQAFDLYDEERYDEAIVSCQASLAMDPSGTTAHSLLGMIYERTGKTAEAVRQYQLVLQMNPDSIADSTKLDSLLSRPGGRRGFPALTRLFSRHRAPAVAGAAALVVVLVGGLFATSRAPSTRTSDTHQAPPPAETPVPGASLPRSAAQSLSMPGAEAGAGPAQPGATSPSGAPQPSAPAQSGSVPSPPAANAWPGLRGAYPPASAAAPGQRDTAAVPGASLPATQRSGQRAAHPDANGFLAPAPVHGVEKIVEGASSGLSPVPGAGLPAFPGAGSPPRTARAGARDPAPVLPPVSGAPEPRPTATASQPPQDAAPAPPPSASISIQPLEETQVAAASRAAPQPSAPQSAATLREALRHQQMAAYYRRQGDHQAAYDEYQYARDLFQSVQQRGGHEAAVAAQGAAAAQNGMSRLRSQ
jgi:hypothetical protein